MDKARMLAMDILKRITIEGAYSGAELDKALFNAKLGKLDNAFVTNIVYGTLNNLYSIDTIIKTYSSIKISKLEYLVLTALRMGIYQLKFMDKVPDYSAVNEMVNIVKTKDRKSANFVNAILRSVIRDDKEIVLKSEIDKLSYEYSIPPFITKMIKDQYKKRATEILEGLRRSKGVFLRVNRTKIDRNTYMEKLIEENLRKEDVSLGVLPDFIHVDNQSSIVNLYGYKEGLFSVQNESAGLSSYALKDCGTKVLDICSAPGGKSLYLQELFNNEGDITSNDIYEAKLKRIQENATRLDLKINTSLYDATRLKEAWINKFNTLICDVPCSGLGLIGRKPDIKINITEENIEEIIKVQKKILNNASRYILKNGILMYSTCTLNKEENENQIMRFLEEHPNFEIEDLGLEKMLIEKAREGTFKNFIAKDGMITILPNQKYDGFFICVLKRMF